MLKFVPPEYGTLGTPYSPCQVLVKMAVTGAQIRTPWVRYSSYSVLSEPWVSLWRESMIAPLSKRPFQIFSYSTKALLDFYQHKSWKNGRTRCQNPYSLSTVLSVPRTLRALCSKKPPYPVPKSVLPRFGALRTPYSPYFVLKIIAVPRTKIRTP